MNDPLRREEINPPAPDRQAPGPSQPDIKKPGRDDLMKRMKRVDPKQSEKYKQRTGE